MTFKVGDIVVCVEGGGYNWLFEGNKYTVSNVLNDGYIELAGHLVLLLLTHLDLNYFPTTRLNQGIKLNVKIYHV